jgi:Asp-tRNA(Asn)/Glu-tRNA(Gln) amidotransferase A subunit family amidase
MNYHRSFLIKGVLPGLLFTLCTSSCSSLEKRRTDRARARAFIAYWPPTENSKGLRLAIKDNIDVKGVVTTVGSEYLAKTRPPASQDAKCLQLAREGNVQIVGKTNLTEFAVTVSGENAYFGTPRNRFDGRHEVIPGGSSSGSAVAVATGLADVALGSDTGGSVRVPAACSGIYGLKTTFGLVPIDGVFPVSTKHLYTVGPMAKDVPHLVQGMALLERGFADRYANAVAAKPSARQITIGRLYLDGTDPAIDKAIDETLATRGFKIIKLNPIFQTKWKQAQKDGKVVAVADAWFNDQQYKDKKEVGLITKAVLALGKMESKTSYKEALSRKKAWQRDLAQVFRKVDFIAVPTLQKLPPKFPFWGSNIVFEALVFDMQNTISVNFAGNPALAIPISMPAKGRSLPVTSLQLVGARRSEAALINAARLIESRP